MDNMTKLSMILCTISLINLIIINYYPTGDWVTSSVITLAFGIPFIFVQIILSIISFFGEQYRFAILVIEVVITIIFFILMYQYIITH